MEHGQETGFSRSLNPHSRVRLGFRANDPFTPSIARIIHNRRVTPGPQKMDDVPLPPRRNVNRRPQPRHRHAFMTDRTTRRAEVRPHIIYDPPQGRSALEPRGSGSRANSVALSIPVRLGPRHGENDDGTEDLEMAPVLAPVSSGASEGLSRYTPAPYSIPSAHSHSSEHHEPISPPKSPAASVASDAKEKTEGYTSTWQTDEPVKLRDFIGVFVMDTMPQQMYLHFLLRLPSLYYTRVTRIFEEADLTVAEIKDMTVRTSAQDSRTFESFMQSWEYLHSGGTNTFPAYQRLQTSWEFFVDNLMREWKTLNIVSVLLLSVIMTMFQIQGAADDPITRYTAFWSLICALMSILYGCLFTIRFASMRKASKAAEWALEADKTQTIFWNVWVMLAMPFVWMSWSILTFIACIMSFMWRSSPKLPPDHVFMVSPKTEFGFRIFICAVLGTGIIYGILIIKTFRHYGTRMDDAWKDRVETFIANMRSDPTYTPSPSRYRSPVTPIHARSRSPESDHTPLVAAALELPDTERAPERISVAPPTRRPIPSQTYPPGLHLHSRSRSHSHSHFGSHSHSPTRSASPPRASFSGESDRGGNIVHSPSNALGTPSAQHLPPTPGEAALPLAVREPDIEENRGRRRTRSHRRHRDRPPILDDDKENAQSSNAPNGSVPPDEAEDIPQAQDEQLYSEANRPGSRSPILSISGFKDRNAAAMRRSDAY